jgi:acyl-CoA synthetase
MPEYFITLEVLPTTASGKILKRALVDMVRDHRIKPIPVRWTPESSMDQTLMAGGTP